MGAVHDTTGAYAVAWMLLSELALLCLLVNILILQQRARWLMPCLTVNEKRANGIRIVGVSGCLATGELDTSLRSGGSSQCCIRWWLLR